MNQNDQNWHVFVFQLVSTKSSQLMIIYNRGKLFLLIYIKTNKQTNKKHEGVRKKDKKPTDAMEW